MCRSPLALSLWILLALFFLTAAKKKAVGTFSSIDSESCPQLKSEKDFFKFLMECGSYRTDTIANVCMQPSDILNAMKVLPDWVYTEDKTKMQGDSIFRSYDFNDFRAAFMWMTQVAQVAEQNDHHPNWSNLYSSVNVKLTSDDKRCLTTYDIELAKAMDSLYIAGNSDV